MAPESAQMVKLAPGWSKMRQHEPKRSLSCLTWPKRAPRSPRWSQDGQVGAKMEPTWRGKVGPRWPSWSQDGPRERQDRAKMAKLEPRWSQHGSKMAKDEPTWADIGTQPGLMLRITAPVQQIRPSKGGATGLSSKMSGGALGRVSIYRE